MREYDDLNKLRQKKDYLLQTIHPHVLSLSVHLGPIKPKRNRIYLLSMPQKEKPIKNGQTIDRMHVTTNKRNIYQYCLISLYLII